MAKKILMVANTDMHIKLCYQPYMKYLKEHGYIVHVATSTNTVPLYCDQKIKIPIYRNPFHIGNICAIFQLKKVINRERYDIVSCSTPMGGVIARLAARGARKKGYTKVLYTAHGFHFYKGCSFYRYGIYFLVEKLLSHFTDILVTINQEDYMASKQHFSVDTRYIKGIGFQTSKFLYTMSESEKTAFRRGLGFHEDDYIITYVAEISKRKRQQYLLKAFSKIPDSSMHLLLVGDSILHRDIKKDISKYHLGDRVKILGFRNDISKILDISNLVVSVSKQEGLPLSIMEAMYKQKPMIVTDCRGNRDLIEHKKNGLVVPIHNETILCKDIQFMKDRREFAMQLGASNKEIIDAYRIEEVLPRYIAIYNELMEEEREKYGGRESIISCKRFLVHCRREFIVLVILGIMITIVSIFAPSMSGELINSILNTKFSLAISLAFAIGILQLFIVILNLLITKTYWLIQKKMILNMRREVCRTVLNLKLDILQNLGQGKFLNRLRDDSSRIALYLGYIKDSIIVAFSNIGVLFVIFYLSPVIGVYYIICTILLLYIRFYGIRKSIYYKALNLKEFDNNVLLMDEVIRGAMDIRVLRLKESFMKEANQSFEQIGNLEYKSHIYMDYTGKLCRFLETLCTGFMVIISILLIQRGALSTSTFIVIFMYRGNVFNFSNKLAQLLNQFGQFNLSLQRILSILKYQGENYGTLELENYQGSITFDAVDFSYDKKNILQDFSLQITGPCFISIVGKSGAGKTTIFNLLTKIYEPQKGNIYLDQYPVSELNEKSLRSTISLVGQKPFLFHMTIRENLSIIDENFENIKKVCKMVGLEEKLHSLPNGYDTKLEEDGCNLSGGERQKLAIARALLSKTKVLLFDEITNNLDSTARRDIEKLLISLKSEYTIIMITHDLEVAKSSDRIIVLEDGKIVGDGSHDELLFNPYYKKLYKGEMI